jgi:ribosomal protein S18 acetylase RimI-like enzyme
MDYVIRPLTSEDEPVLWEMAYQGMQKTEKDDALPAHISRPPELARYVEGWGLPGDTGFIAHDPKAEKPIGAVWLRASAQAGSAGEAAAIPELAFAVRPSHRRRGIGAALLTQWVKANPAQSAVTLAVPATSPAVRLYERFGFKVINESDRAVTMQREV